MLNIVAGFISFKSHNWGCYYKEHEDHRNQKLAYGGKIQIKDVQI